VKFLENIDNAIMLEHTVSYYDNVTVFLWNVILLSYEHYQIIITACYPLKKTSRTTGALNCERETKGTTNKMKGNTKLQNFN
jgi:hypothetical protein